LNSARTSAPCEPGDELPPLVLLRDVLALHAQSTATVSPQDDPIERNPKPGEQPTPAGDPIPPICAGGAAARHVPGARPRRGRPARGAAATGPPSARGSRPGAGPSPPPLSPPPPAPPQSPRLARFLGWEVPKWRGLLDFPTGKVERKLISPRVENRLRSGVGAAPAHELAWGTAHVSTQLESAWSSPNYNSAFLDRTLSWAFMGSESRQHE
jgi:hypothetical protein